LKRLHYLSLWKEGTIDLYQLSEEKENVGIEVAGGRGNMK